MATDKDIQNIASQINDDIDINCGLTEGVEFDSEAFGSRRVSRYDDESNYPGGPYKLPAGYKPTINLKKYGKSPYESTLAEDRAPTVIPQPTLTPTPVSETPRPSIGLTSRKLEI